LKTTEPSVLLMTLDRRSQVTSSRGSIPRFVYRRSTARPFRRALGFEAVSFEAVSFDAAFDPAAFDAAELEVAFAFEARPARGSLWDDDAPLGDDEVSLARLMDPFLTPFE